MLTLCSCDDALQNTGEVNCKSLLTYAAGIIAMSYFDQDGNVNQIDLTDTLDQAYVTAKLNNADKYQRWYPIMNLKNIEDKRGDTTFQEFDDGSKYPVNDGMRDFVGYKPQVTPDWVGNIESFACGTIGIFIIGAGGELQGNASEAGYLKPFLISPNSWIAKYVKPTPKEVSMLHLAFAFDQSERDKDIKQILASEFDDVNFLTINGLIDVTVSYTTHSTTTLKFTLSANLGTALNPVKIEGLVAGDFAVYNVTDSASIGFTGSGGSFTDNGDGVYTIVYNTANQPGAADVIRLTPSKNGYDFSAVVANTVATV